MVMQTFVLLLDSFYLTKKDANLLWTTMGILVCGVVQQLAMLAFA